MPSGRSEDVDGRANRVAPVTKPAPTADPSRILQLRVEQPAPDVQVIMVAGELDILSAPALEERVDRQLVFRLRGLIIDLTELSFLGCAGVLVLIRAREAAQRKKVPLLLVCNSTALLRILKICDVLDKFAISPTLGDALSGVPKDNHRAELRRSFGVTPARGSTPDPAMERLEDSRFRAWRT